MTLSLFAPSFTFSFSSACGSTPSISAASFSPPSSLLLPRRQCLPALPCRGCSAGSPAPPQCRHQPQQLGTRRRTRLDHHPHINLVQPPRRGARAAHHLLLLVDRAVTDRTAAVFPHRCVEVILACGCLRGKNRFLRTQALVQEARKEEGASTRVAVCGGRGAAIR
jgi:hypothetical protein